MTDRHAASPDSPREISCPQQGRCDVRLQREWRVRCHYRYSTNMQVAIDTDTRLVIATGDPCPGNRNDCTVYRDCGIEQELADRAVMADGGYQGTV